MAPMAAASVALALVVLLAAAGAQVPDSSAASGRFFSGLRKSNRGHNRVPINYRPHQYIEAAHLPVYKDNGSISKLIPVLKNTSAPILATAAVDSMSEQFSSRVGTFSDESFYQDTAQEDSNDLHRLKPIRDEGLDNIKTSTRVSTNIQIPFRRTYPSSFSTPSQFTIPPSRVKFTLPPDEQALLTSLNLQLKDDSHLKQHSGSAQEQAIFLTADLFTSAQRKGTTKDLLDGATKWTSGFAGNRPWSTPRSAGGLRTSPLYPSDKYNLTTGKASSVSAILSSLSQNREIIPTRNQEGIQLFQQVPIASPFLQLTGVTISGLNLEVKNNSTTEPSLSNATTTIQPPQLSSNFSYLPLKELYESLLTTTANQPNSQSPNFGNNEFSSPYKSTPSSYLHLKEQYKSSATSPTEVNIENFTPESLLQDSIMNGSSSEISQLISNFLDTFDKGFIEDKPASILSSVDESYSTLSPAEELSTPDTPDATTFSQTSPTETSLYVVSSQESGSGNNSENSGTSPTSTSISYLYLKEKFKEQDGKSTTVGVNDNFQLSYQGKTTPSSYLPLKDRYKNSTFLQKSSTMLTLQSSTTTDINEDSASTVVPLYVSTFPETSSDPTNTVSDMIPNDSSNTDAPSFDSSILPTTTETYVSAGNSLETVPPNIPSSSDVSTLNNGTETTSLPFITSSETPSNDLNNIGSSKPEEMNPDTENFETSSTDPTSASLSSDTAYPETTPSYETYLPETSQPEGTGAAITEIYSSSQFETQTEIENIITDSGSFSDPFSATATSNFDPLETVSTETSPNATFVTETIPLTETQKVDLFETTLRPISNSYLHLKEKHKATVNATTSTTASASISNQSFSPPKTTPSSYLFLKYKFKTSTSSEPLLTLKPDNSSTNITDEASETQTESFLSGPSTDISSTNISFQTNTEIPFSGDMTDALDMDSSSEVDTQATTYNMETNESIISEDIGTSTILPDISAIPLYEIETHTETTLLETINTEGSFTGSSSMGISLNEDESSVSSVINLPSKQSFETTTLGLTTHESVSTENSQVPETEEPKENMVTEEDTSVLTTLSEIKDLQDTLTETTHTYNSQNEIISLTNTMLPETTPNVTTGTYTNLPDLYETGTQTTEGNYVATEFPETTAAEYDPDMSPSPISNDLITSSDVENPSEEASTEVTTFSYLQLKEKHKASLNSNQSVVTSPESSDAYNTSYNTTTLENISQETFGPVTNSPMITTSFSYLPLKDKHKITLNGSSLNVENAYEEASAEVTTFSYLQLKEKHKASLNSNQSVVTFPESSDAYNTSYNTTTLENISQETFGPVTNSPMITTSFSYLPLKDKHKITLNGSSLVSVQVDEMNDTIFDTTSVEDLASDLAHNVTHIPTASSSFSYLGLKEKYKITLNGSDEQSTSFMESEDLSPLSGLSSAETRLRDTDLSQTATISISSFPAEKEEDNIPVKNYPSDHKEVGDNLDKSTTRTYLSTYIPLKDRIMNDLLDVDIKENDKNSNGYEESKTTTSEYFNDDVARNPNKITTSRKILQNNPNNINRPVTLSLIQNLDKDEEYDDSFFIPLSEQSNSNSVDEDTISGSHYIPLQMNFGSLLSNIESDPTLLNELDNDQNIFDITPKPTTAFNYLLLREKYRTTTTPGLFFITPIGTSNKDDKVGTPTASESPLLSSLGLTNKREQTTRAIPISDLELKPTVNPPFVIRVDEENAVTSDHPMSTVPSNRYTYSSSETQVTTADPNKVMFTEATRDNAPLTTYSYSSNNPFKPNYDILQQLSAIVRDVQRVGNQSLPLTPEYLDQPSQSLGNFPDSFETQLTSGSDNPLPASIQQTPSSSFSNSAPEESLNLLLSSYQQQLANLMFVQQSTKGTNASVQQEMEQLRHEIILQQQKIQQHVLETERNTDRTYTEGSVDSFSITNPPPKVSTLRTISFQSSAVSPSDNLRSDVANVTEASPSVAAQFNPISNSAAVLGSILSSAAVFSSIPNSSGGPNLVQNNAASDDSLSGSSAAITPFPSSAAILTSFPSSAVVTPIDSSQAVFSPITSSPSTLAPISSSQTISTSISSNQADLTPVSSSPAIFTPIPSPSAIFTPFPSSPATITPFPDLLPSVGSPYASRSPEHDSECLDPAVRYACGTCGTMVMCLGTKAYTYDCAYPMTSCQLDDAFGAECKPGLSPECDCSPGQTRKPDPYDPRSFIICSATEAVAVDSCAELEHFSPTENQCIPEPASPSCTALGSFSNPNDCQWYFCCLWPPGYGNFQKISIRCPSDQVFSMTDRVCKNPSALLDSDVCKSGTMSIARLDSSLFTSTELPQSSSSEATSTSKKRVATRRPTRAPAAAVVRKPSVPPVAVKAKVPVLRGAGGTSSVTTTTAATDVSKTTVPKQYTCPIVVVLVIYWYPGVVDYACSVI